MATTKTRGRRVEREVLAGLRPTCPGCLARFAPTRPRQRFCRQGCRALAEAPERPTLPGLFNRLETTGRRLRRGKGKPPPA